MALHDLLALQDAGGDRFFGPTRKVGRSRPFGGHLLAQTMIAACRTVDTDVPPHSLQMGFFRSGTIDDPIGYEVERLRDGRRFAARQVRATQNGSLLTMAQVSFQHREQGAEYQERMPDVPPPDGLPSEADLRAQAFAEADVAWCLSPLFPDLDCEVRPVQPRNFIDPDPVEPRLDLWTRFTEEPRPDERAAFVACLSDVLLLSAALLPHGISWSTTPVEGSTLNHALWLHEVGDLGGWMLWSLRTLWTGGTRALVRGQLWSRDGRLIATAMQEGLIRISGPTATRPAEPTE